MFENIFLIWRPRLVFVFLLCVIVFILFLPIFSNHVYPSIGDYRNHLVALIQAKLALAEGQFPLRIAPLEQQGFRYPFFQFYSSTSYTVAALIYQWLTPSAPFLAIKLTMGLTLVVGGIYIYRLAYWFVPSKSAAILASVVYLTSPYLICLVNDGGFFNEALGLGLLPLVIYYNLQQYYFRSDRMLLLAALSWYLLITVHLITFIYTSFFFALFLISLTLSKYPRWKNLFSVGFAYLFGCLLAMWYLGPIAVWHKYLVVSETIGDVQPFNKLSAALSALLSPRAYFGLIEVTKTDIINLMMQPNIGLPLLFALSLSIYLFFKRRIYNVGEAKQWFLPSLGLACLVFFALWSPINFWAYLPRFFLIIEVPYRLLSQMMWLGTFLFAGAIYWIFQKELNLKQLLIGILLIVLSTSAWYFNSHAQYDLTSAVMADPHFLKQRNSYVIHPFVYKNVNVVDSMYANFLGRSQLSENVRYQYEKDKWESSVFLRFNYQYVLSKKLFVGAYDPVLYMQGQIPVDADKNNQSIDFFIDKHWVKNYKMQSGKFEWTLALKKFIEQSKNSDLALELKHHDDKKYSEGMVIPLKSILFENYLNPSHVLTVTQMQPYCFLEGEDTVCDVQVPADVSLLELPVSFYPDMLEVTLNGKAVNYLNVLHGKLITGVTPISGQRNQIKIHFQGLMWANFISATMWCLWGAGWLFVMLYYLRQSKKRELCTAI